MSILGEKLHPQRITDVLDKIDLYLEQMRKKDDKTKIPKILTNYIWNFFRDVNPDKEKLKMLAVFVVDHTYRYAANVKLTDDYTQIYFATVITELWDAIQARGVDTFYILDNRIREGRFMLTIQLFALSGVAVVTPYSIKESYHKYTVMINPEIIEQKWFLPSITTCYSLPGIYLRRHHFYFQVRFMDLKGKTHTKIYKGGKAAALQQEIDHINGVLVCD